MYHLLYLSPVTMSLAVVLVLFLLYVLFEDVDEKKATAVTVVPEAPGPKVLPIIGNLHLLGGYEVPYQAFTALAKKYGDVIRMQLGSVPSLIVNGQENIKEVLVTKGHHFDSRPNFQRYHQLFCGDKENSLAFSDFTDLQKMRRDMLRTHTFPRSFTSKFNHLDEIISEEVNRLVSSVGPGNVQIKPLVLRCCANIFINHFCSKGFDDSDLDFVQMVNNFDEIFYEVNQGYAADFLPFLLPLHSRRLQEMSRLAHKIRDFILDRIIGDRFNNWREDSEPQDYVESLIDHVKTESSPKMDWDTALFALEDIIGGHSAVGNFLVKVLGYVATRPEVQKKMQEEIDACSGNATILQRNQMPYTEAVLWESIRLIASPIVPRVANQDSTVAGYKVKKGTLIFMNNYELSMSEKLWTDPEQFKPERFIKDGRLVKPDHFLPFGGGRRSCMGYKMVQLVGFGVISGLMQNFEILPVAGQCYKVPVGSLALPVKDTYRLSFRSRR